MSKYKRKIPDADPEAARSWIGKFIRDTKLSELGYVVGVIELKDGSVRLQARFPGEKRDRKIALEPTPNMEYVMPGDVRARYRPPTDADLARVHSLAKTA
jgi:hypothetical protein